VIDHEDGGFSKIGFEIEYLLKFDVACKRFPAWLGSLEIDELLIFFTLIWT